MGEISEALRRAKQARGDGPSTDASPAGRVGGRWRTGNEAVRAPTAPEAPESDVTAELPGDRRGDWKSRAVAVEPRGVAAEACRHLALHIRGELERLEVRSLAIAGALRGEGKTLLACDIALALASITPRREVALVDLDLRRPSIAGVFRLEPSVGIEDCLTKGSPLADACISLEKPRLDVYPARLARADAHEILIQPPFARVIRELESRYATVVVDTPPAVLVPDSSLILRSVGAWAAVARAGSTRKKLFRNMLELLPRDRLLGGIVNEGRLAISTKYGYYSYGPDEDERGDD